MEKPELPTGTVTFVLADVEGSVRLWESQRAAMAEATSRFDALVTELVALHGGVRPVEQGEGDSFVAAFHVARDAVAFVFALQRAIDTESWAGSLPLRVRAAVHTGAAELRGHDNYMGPTVNRCARIRALAYGGQVLLSGATGELVADDLDDGVRLLDLGFHALRDFDRAEHLFQLAHPDLPDRFPPLREQGKTGRLPTVLTTFVARSREMAMIADLMERSRLVTLIGAGGSGKTRLALECARTQVRRFPDGVAWADAAPISDGSLVASCVGAALDVREVAGEPLLETLVRELRTREALVVLDNCEHVIYDVARVAERLLDQCPALRLLATSREPIGVSGETSMRVPSLEDEAAVQLFVDRARAVRPDFALTTECEPAVRDVCRRLDGIPLAIELAASRVRVLTPRQVADGLADRFRLLTGGARTAMPRQRTLEASVDWSYRLLSESERRFLGRLSVFAGGFTIEAAQHVCVDDELAESSILDLLTALVDKSLVQADSDGAGTEARYRMLETIRHYARQRLADSADATLVRDRHLACFLGMAEEVGPRIEQGDELVWLERLDTEFDNLRAAFDWAEQSGAADLFVRLAAATWLFWEIRCRFVEGCAWLQRAVAAAPEPSRARAMALYGLGDMSLFVPDIELVVASGHDVVAMGEQLGDPAVAARGTTLLGWAACYGAYRDPHWAVDALGAVVDGLSDGTEPWLQCDAGLALGYAYMIAGDIASAAAAIDRALDGATRWRSVGSIQRALFFRGWCHALVGEVDDGEALLVRAVHLADDLDDTFWKALSLAGVGYARFLRGDLDGARAAADEAVTIGDRYRNPFATAIGEEVVALVHVRRGDLDDARAALERIGPTVEALGFDWLRAWNEGLAALVEAARGDVGAARGRLDAAARADGGGAYTRGVLALYRAWVERLDGDDAAAESAATDAVAALAESGVRALTAAALDELGIGAARREQFERAACLFVAADAERDRLAVAPQRWPEVFSRDDEPGATSAAPGDEVFAAGNGADSALGLEAAVRFALRGKGGRRRPTSGWESLTPTELDVVRLVREGLTNPAIAEKLLVTRGTVKVHLSHIFTKLGVGSRSQLAAEAALRAAACGDTSGH